MERNPKDEIVKPRQWTRTAAVLEICLDYSSGDLYILPTGLFRCDIASLELYSVFAKQLISALNCLTTYDMLFSADILDSR
jgi:hypothetical protein